MKFWVVLMNSGAKAIVVDVFVQMALCSALFLHSYRCGYSSVKFIKQLELHGSANRVGFDGGIARPRGGSLIHQHRKYCRPFDGARLRCSGVRRPSTMTHWKTSSAHLACSGGMILTIAGLDDAVDAFNPTIGLWGRRLSTFLP
ncbi:hypothetical protein DFO70_1447 [Cytobacillus firmus]|uniref:Uncharacterized protein n=2 Tax=Cytobacillus TaxID=2675230 RepID=A0A366JG23_CYTFI|nr:hypothetical protein DFO70_1447 [Cytobacillus firmus]TDX35483.1 hypothetical protein DFO72_12717 [Cytobacillus oceanisediminis]